YVRNSPTNLVDPSGNVSITSIDVATSGDGLGLVKKLGPKLGKQFGFGFKVTVTGVTCGDDITDAKVHQFIFNYTLYKGPKKALFRLKKDGIDGKEYNDPFGKEEKGVLEDANKDWESLVGSFKSSAWDNELGHDKNITGSYVEGVNDPKKKDQNIQKKGNKMIIW